MQFTFAAITALLATAVVAAPRDQELKPKLKWVDNNCGPKEPETDSSCLSDEQAKTIIDTYETLISRSVTGAEFNSTVDALLDAEFFTMSNGINAEVGKPVRCLLVACVDCRGFHPTSRRTASGYPPPNYHR